MLFKIFYIFSSNPIHYFSIHSNSSFQTGNTHYIQFIFLFIEILLYLMFLQGFRCLIKELHMLLTIQD